MQDLATAVNQSPTGLQMRVAPEIASAGVLAENAGYSHLAATPAVRTAPAIEVLLCRDPAMLQSAQRLRYEVYCLEFGRQSPYADHDRKIIKDPLDTFGHTFAAIADGETIGTMRTNFSHEGPLGPFEELYGMRASKHHPGRTAICTKFIVKRAKRGSLAFLNLMVAWLRYVTAKGALECYIDCTPNLVAFYERCEFRLAGAPFSHYENGLSVPMKLDLAQHGQSLCARMGLRDPRSLAA